MYYQFMTLLKEFVKFYIRIKGNLEKGFIWFKLVRNITII